MTREQAFQILGITSEELQNHEVIQKLLDANADHIQLNSLFEGGAAEGGKQIKVRNFQALINENYNHTTTTSA